MRKDRGGRRALGPRKNLPVVRAAMHPHRALRSARTASKLKLCNGGENVGNPWGANACSSRIGEKKRAITRQFSGCACGVWGR